ncbi:hypothetical protein [Saccharopolyspora kobensis]|uniref:hypothetical protein n=1 Tax=Saccharopolyspora kobensis TaxID=146035 RepID=UPI001F3BAADA|nr:hypothetical protein [Saccharopolyspora kobensis]
MPSPHHLTLCLRTQQHHQRLMHRTAQLHRPTSLGQPHLHPERVEPCHDRLELVAVEGAFVFTDHHRIEPTIRALHRGQQG